MKSCWKLIFVTCLGSMLGGCGGSGGGAAGTADRSAAEASGVESAATEAGVAATSLNPELAAPAGPYVVPAAEPAALLDFINELANREPAGANEAEVIQDYRHIMIARLQAADRILAHSPIDPGLREATVVSQIDSLRSLATFDPSGMGQQFLPFVEALMNGDNPKLALLGRVGKFQYLLDRYGNHQTDDAAQVVTELRDVLASELAGYPEFLATQFAGVVLQERGESELASRALQLVAERFQDASDPDLAGEAQKLFADVAFRGKVIQATKGEEKDVAELLRAAQERLAEPNQEVLAATVNAAQMLEYSGQFPAAELLFGAIGEKFKGHADKTLADMARRTVELAVKRLGLIGHKVQLQGNLLDGTPFDWDDYQGKVVLIDFWAAYSSPWHDEVPNLRDTYNEYHGRGFEVVGVNLDEDPQQAYAYLRAQPLPWKTILDDTAPGFANPTAFEFGVQAVPFFVLVARDGKVAKIHCRGAELKAQVAELLKQAVPPDEQQGQHGRRPRQLAERPQRLTLMTAVRASGDATEDLPDAGRSTAGPAVVDRSSAAASCGSPAQEDDTENPDIALNEIPLEAINPYAPDRDASPSELVETILEMKTRPRSIQRRKGFSEGVIEAADRVLKSDAPVRLKHVALLAKLEYLQREAALGDDKADLALQQVLNDLESELPTRVAAEVRFLRLEQEVLQHESMPCESLGPLLDRVADFFGDTTATERHLRLASATISAANRLDDGDVREKYFQQFGKLWAQSPAPELARYGRRIAAPPASSPGESLVGKPVELRGITVDGAVFDWKSYQGKIVLIDFWATWCGPCRRAMPELKALYQKHQDAGFSVVGINLDEDAEAVADYLKEVEVPWTILFGAETRELAARYNPRGAIPALLLIGRDGNVVAASSDLAELSREVDKLLAP